MVQVDSMLMEYIVFGLILIRISGLVVFAPFFGAQQFPVLVRVGLAAFLSLLMFSPATEGLRLPSVLNVGTLFLLVLQEVSLGIVIGFLASLVFMGAQLAGQLVGTQVGFAMANVVDPLSDSEVSILGFLNFNLAILVFLFLNLHLLFIWVLWGSYRAVGIGQLAFPAFRGSAGEEMMRQADHMMLVALQLAMPVLVVMLLNSVVEGFVTRTMPQMNIMVLGLPLRVTLGVTAFWLGIPAMVYSLAGTGWEEAVLHRGQDGSLREMLESLMRMVEEIGGATIDWGAAE